MAKQKITMIDQRFPSEGAPVYRVESVINMLDPRPGTILSRKEVADPLERHGDAVEITLKAAKQIGA